MNVVKSKVDPNRSLSVEWSRRWAENKRGWWGLFFFLRIEVAVDRQGLNERFLEFKVPPYSPILPSL
jgi:hypothetical protein